jgi:APA family basic amino acid/polyamine antiporter
MALDGVFPGYAGRLHATRRTPVAATLTQAIIAAMMVWAGSLEELLGFASVGFAAISGLTVASVIPIRKRTDLAHPYRLPFYPIPPLAYLLLIGWTIGYMLVKDEKQRYPGLLSLAVILLGIPLSRVIGKPKQNTNSSPH